MSFLAYFTSSIEMYLSRGPEFDAAARLERFREAISIFSENRFLLKSNFIG
jgi:hypothetical protein